MVTIGISWWAKRENVTPVVHSHGDSESQYQALEDLPTMVSLEDNSAENLLGIGQNIRGTIADKSKRKIDANRQISDANMITISSSFSN